MYLFTTVDQGATLPKNVAEEEPPPLPSHHPFPSLD